MNGKLKGKIKMIVCAAAAVLLFAGCGSREAEDNMQAVQLSGEGIGAGENQMGNQDGNAGAGIASGTAGDPSREDLYAEIPEGQILEQSFEVTLDGWGEVTFASFAPEQDTFQKDGIWMYGDVRFMLLKDGKVVYTFPEAFEDNGMTGQQFGQVVSVAFRDYNEDGRTDVLLILEYAGVQGIDIGTAWMEARVYNQKEGEKAFFLDNAAAGYVNRNAVWGEPMTMEDVEQSLAEYAGQYSLSTSFSAWEVEQAATADYWRLQEEALNERLEYYRESAYYQEIAAYWENVRGVTDIANRTDFLFDTDARYYTAEDFQGEPSLVIHLAKNEIYARHGYIFEDPDLYNYFMGCIWYAPATAAKDFDASVFNEYERENVKILAGLDEF